MGRRGGEVHRLGWRIFRGSPDDRISSESVKRVKLQITLCRRYPATKYTQDEMTMKNVTKIAFLTILAGIALTAFGQQQKEPVDYVSPNIGGIGQLLTATIPYVQRPYGMARIAPITTPGNHRPLSGR